MSSKLEAEEKVEQLQQELLQKMDKSKMAKLFNKHKMTSEQIEKDLKTSLRTGLTAVEARKRLEQEGANELEAPDEKSLWERIAEQFDDILVKILLASATISFIIAVTGKCSTRAFSNFLFSFLRPHSVCSLATLLFPLMKFNLA